MATPINDARALELLCRGSLELVGRLADATNATFFGRLTLADESLDTAAIGVHEAPRTAACVYKPVRGERPLDDFPDGTLARREYAAFLLSETIGWRIVPPTVIRDGPLGEGMVQLWVEADPEADVVDMVLAPDPRLRRIAIFDAIANNADRKGSHVLPVVGGHVHAVDHGVCFAEQPKLRTVLWAWRGELLTEEELAAVERAAQALDADLGAALHDLLARREVAATRRRVDTLLRRRRFPQPDPTRPAVPWPPF
ncbi:MAG TPA: SCO1664 family protein [Candidatus Caenarcaniphilales bacterium]|nr:SCO1664 family protein [Candidatus Caenarcaniphilales bacterium]